MLPFNIHLSLSTTPMMKMTLPLSLLLSLLLLHTANAFDITQILNNYPDFSTFNSYLTQTNLAAEINAQHTATVLVVDNANISPLSSKSINLIKSILSVHVILDYFDAAKLQTLSTTSALATTLYQTTGHALGQQGFLNVTRMGTSVAFTSAMPGSPPGSNFLKSIFSIPYNASVLQVSGAIIPQGIDGTKTSSPPSKAPSATPGATPPPPVSAAPTTVPSTSSPPPVASTPPPTPSAAAVPSTVPSTSSPPPVASTPPPTPSAAAVPSTAPPTSSKAPVPLPSTAPPKPSVAPVPSTAPPTSSKAPLPSSVPPMAQAPTTAATPSASPALTPTANAPGPASAPGAEAPASETPGETTPAEGTTKGKSAGKALEAGLAVVFTMVLSTLYLASSTI